MNYKGTIIQESLTQNYLPADVKVIDSREEKVTLEHHTPWLAQWTLLTVEIPEEKAEEVAEQLSKELDYSHGTSWYADFKNADTHFIIYKNKVFKIPRSNPEAYNKPREYGLALGIPELQVDFSPNIK